MAHTVQDPVNILRILKQEVQRRLYELKAKIEAEVNSKIEELVDEVPYVSFTPPLNLSSPLNNFQIDKEQIKNDLLNYACHAEAQKFVKEQIYDRAMTLLDQVKQPVDKQKSNLEGLKMKLQSVIAKISQIYNTMQIMSGIVTALNIAHLALDAAISLLPLRFATGKVIQKLQEALDKVQVIAFMLQQAIKNFTKILAPGGFIERKVNTLQRLIDAVLRIVDSILQLISQIRQTIELYYLLYIQNCAQNQDLVDSEGNINEDLLPSEINPLDHNGLLNADVLSDYYRDTMETLKGTEFIDKIYSANFKMVGYNRYKV